MKPGHSYHNVLVASELVTGQLEVIIGTGMTHPKFLGAAASPPRFPMPELAQISVTTSTSS